MQIFVSKALRVTNPSPEIIEWAKQSLTIPNPEYAKKVRMNLWLGNTPKTLSLYEKHGNELILPFGVLRELPKEIVKDTVFTSVFAEHKPVDFNANVPLYGYQETAVDALIRAKYGILQSPAGSGKTQMGIALAAQLKRRTLWLCHTLDLINQSRDRALMYMDKSVLGTITGGKVELGTGITFATIQTMSRIDLTHLKDYWDVIITDEVHRVSGSPTAVTQYQKVLNSLSARHKYGLSATVHRADGMIKATYTLTGRVVHEVPKEAVANKIMRVGIRPVGTGVKIDRAALNTDGTLNYSKLITYLTYFTERNEIIARAIEANIGKSSLILSDRLEHLERIIRLLPPSMREDAVLISGKMTSKKEKAFRNTALEAMRTGQLKYLFATYALAKEGLDIPRLERLYLATPQKDYAIITQAIGRIARTFSDKGNPVAYDFVDDIGYCVKGWKKRCATYKKNDCYFLEN